MTDDENENLVFVFDPRPAARVISSVLVGAVLIWGGLSPAWSMKVDSVLLMQDPTLPTLQARSTFSLLAWPVWQVWPLGWHSLLAIPGWTALLSTGVALIMMCRSHRESAFMAGAISLILSLTAALFLGLVYLVLFLSPIGMLLDVQEFHWGWGIPLWGLGQSLLLGLGWWRSRDPTEDVDGLEP